MLGTVLAVEWLMDILSTQGLLILGCLVFFSYTAQAMTGFGSIVIAVTIGSLFFPIRSMLPVLVALNMPLCLWILYKQHQEIDYRFLLRQILPLMSIGVVIGLLVDRLIEGPLLRQIFGGIILAFSIRELLILFSKKEDSVAKRGWMLISQFWILIAGLVHGIYASGGPPLVYALSKTSMSRQTFRATLTAVWLVLNGVLLGVYIGDGRFAYNESIQFLFLLPTIPVALWSGEKLHKRVSERSFRITLQGLLALSAAALLV